MIEANYDTDDYLMVATTWKRLSLKKGMKQQNLLEDRYNANKLIDDQTREEYQIDIANRYSALAISSVDDTWEVSKHLQKEMLGF